MAVKTQSFIVTTTRQALTIPDTDTQDGCMLWVYGEYHGSSNKCAIGGDDVTMATGVHIYGGEKFGPIILRHGETLHAISDAALGLDLRVIVTGA